jgi:methylglutamate dehydrogenase subunit B
MRIACPHCGLRDVREFTYLGDATLERPDPQAPDALERFVSYVFMRDNAAGAHRELWYHGAGCQAWLAVERDTRTHVISAVSSYKATP